MSSSTLRPLPFAFRIGLELDLADLHERPRLAQGFRLTPWNPARLDELAEVEHAAYLGSEDARVFPSDLATIVDCRRSLDRARRHPGVDLERSLVLLYGDALVGHVLAWAERPTRAFIHDLAVHPDHRRGAGRALLLACLNRYQRAGFRRVGLSVTAANLAALRLYESLGFRDTSWWIELVPRR
jgi:ribosomal protein S18 acetylase RimI-like enzyme